MLVEINSQILAHLYPIQLHKYCKPPCTSTVILRIDLLLQGQFKLTCFPHYFVPASPSIAQPENHIKFKDLLLFSVLSVLYHVGIFHSYVQVQICRHTFAGT